MRVDNYFKNRSLKVSIISILNYWTLEKTSRDLSRYFWSLARAKGLVCDELVLSLIPDISNRLEVTLIADSHYWVTVTATKSFYFHGKRNVVSFTVTTYNNGQQTSDIGSLEQCLL